MGLTREQLLIALGIVKEGVDLEAITKKAMFDYENEHWRKNLENAPHGEPWHTSFHASSFPGDEKSCVRKLLYTMMDTPEVEPIPAKLRGQAEMGKAVEEFITHKWRYAGILLGDQVKFTEDELMLTGSADAILNLAPQYNSVLPVDIKSKDHNVISEMQLGMRSYDKKHWEQLQAYIYFCKTNHKKLGWDELGLKPAKSGIIYYASRQDPTFVKQFYIRADEEFIERGIENLLIARDNYVDGSLPARPKDWKWSEEPCKWCPFKKFACKPDDKAGVEELEESNAIDYANHVRPGYDYEKTRQEVWKRWK